MVCAVLASGPYGIRKQNKPTENELIKMINISSYAQQPHHCYYLCKAVTLYNIIEWYINLVKVIRHMQPE